MTEPINCPCGSDDLECRGNVQTCRACGRSWKILTGPPLRQEPNPEGQNPTGKPLVPPQKHKADAGKPLVQLVPGHVIEWMGWILLYGRGKYGEEAAMERRWREVEGHRIYGSVLRHLCAWDSGESLDPESGLPHLAHALTCLMQLVDIELPRRPSCPESS